MRILFVHNSLRSFVRVDRDILSSRHTVDELDLSVPSRITTLPNRLARADLVYAWFASLHSLGPIVAARLLRKPSIAVVGGYDTANMPEIGYGYMGHPWKRYVVRAICASATALVVNSHTAEEEVLRNVGPRTGIHMIYHGFILPEAAVALEREPVALSVGTVSRESLRRKGHEVFVRAAAHLPQTQFILAGGCPDDAADWLRSIASPNVEIRGFVSQTELTHLFGRASVYVQASEHEGFGCSLVEAMAAGCMPVVSRRGALPEVVGEHGFYADESDPLSVVEAIRVAAHSTRSERIAVAKYAATTFPLDRRQRTLLELISAIAEKWSGPANSKAGVLDRGALEALRVQRTVSDDQTVV